MPLHRRLPKRGFVSPLRDTTAEVRLSDLQRMKAEAIDLKALKAEGVVGVLVLVAKVILCGEIKRKLTLTGLRVSKGARAAIEKAGGNVVDIEKTTPPAKLPKKPAPAAGAAK